MNYLTTTLHGSQVTIRDIEEQDINHIVNYWHNSNKEYLESIGADIKKITSREMTANAFRQSIPAHRKEKDRITLIASSGEELIGYTNVNFDQLGDAYAHIHLINKKFRNRGIARVVFTDVINVFFTRFGLDSLFFQTNTQNKPINLFLHKLGFSIESTSYQESPNGMATKGSYHLYKIDKSSFTTP